MGPASDLEMVTGIAESATLKIVTRLTARVVQGPAWPGFGGFGLAFGGLGLTKS